ncbi:GIY-YIG nuclease family protein [Dyadobacter jiangsuensis]
MDKKSVLDEIFSNDPFGMLNAKPSIGHIRDDDDRLIASFNDIITFYQKTNREPQQGAGIQEHTLYSRLKAIRENPEKSEKLKEHDKYGLLKFEQKEFNSLDDILNDDSLGLLNDADSESLFQLKHVAPQDERASADFIAKRKPCKDFAKYESQFKQVQKDLAGGKRRLIEFREEILNPGEFYVHNGILLLLEDVNFEEDILPYKSGSRLRKDGRTRIIFENGTESNMLFRSLYKSLLANGKAVSENSDKVNERFQEKFGAITDEDQEAGFIYILKSKSDKPEISEIKNLYKIGYSKIPVEDRIKNASIEPTYLMADVRIVTAFKCYNMNPQKLELLLHTFFGSACLNVDVFDLKGLRHTPREWFIAPLYAIEQAIQLTISGEITKFIYQPDKEEIMPRQ